MPLTLARYGSGTYLAAARPTLSKCELLRAVEKLRDEALRNGNINWSDSFERLVTFLRS
ncbi:hypothetical protein ACIBHX_30000 [Nonomuraea sp. NPDC050536]|uniref:hypothetical protein n=1 Tax=Nonomuraea sp. NPDC050536 TaxID=3364366 RepID=UPI0037C5C227